MKLIKILHRCKNQLLAYSLNNPIDLNKHATFYTRVIILIFIATAIWIAGPRIAWYGYAPLESAEKRIYTILSLCLIWLLKFLIFDFSPLPPLYYHDAAVRKKLQSIQNHLRNSLGFLSKTAIGDKALIDLPLFLLLGPPAAGKTAWLTHSEVNFTTTLSRTEEFDCKFWSAKNMTLIDVPGKYLNIQCIIKKSSFYALVWNFFLRSLKKRCGKKGIAGIIIALPLPEIIQQDEKQYPVLLQGLAQRFTELKKIFPNPIPCYFVITKCDLLPGFKEFFAESSKDETNKAWGITLTHPPFSSSGKNEVHALLTAKFNELIKKLNHQLLYRLHQERNPKAKPYIKDFPLQVERLKEFILDFIKKFSNPAFIFSLHGIYLSSALQTNQTDEMENLNELTINQHHVEIYKTPSPLSRPYFIKQIITHHLTPKNYSEWINGNQQPYLAYGSAFFLIGLVAMQLGMDFKRSVQQINDMQHAFTAYQAPLTKFQTPYDRLYNAVTLVNRLEKNDTHTVSPRDILHLFPFYSHKSQQKVHAAYKNSLRTILLPEIKNYLGEYLKNPVNKNLDSIYTTLKAYLMLADKTHFQAEFIANTLEDDLPSFVTEKDRKTITHYLQRCMKEWSPLLLDEKLIHETREFLTTTPSFQLSYIILKNISVNNIKNTVNLGTNTKTVFTNQKNHISTMFTAKAFSNTFSQETMIAAHETISGNWVLGHFNVNEDPKLAKDLIEQLRNTYIENYAYTWEDFLANIHVNKANNLEEIDTIITILISNESPLLQLLQIIYENTFFEPIISVSPQLQNLGLLIAKNKASSNNLLYEIFTSLQTLHQNLFAILHAENEKKAAFDLISERLHNPKKLDAITQLHLSADKSPDPIKHWLNKLANDVWHFLLQDASFYMDTSQTQVGDQYT